MRRLDRTAVAAPTSLTLPHPDVQTEMDEVRDYYGNWAPGTKAFDFKQYRADDVKVALRAMSRSKCAYCESNIWSTRADQVEHYRPKGKVTGLINHPGYWWLAHSWTNLLPTCRGCNLRLRGFIVTRNMTQDEIERLRGEIGLRAQGKGNQFRIVGPRVMAAPGAGDGEADLALEEPLLIDPCRRDPKPELSWDWGFSLSLVAPAARVDGSLSPYGEETIQCCALNRFDLVEARTQVLDELRIQRTQILEDLEAAEPARRAHILERARLLVRFAEPAKPFSAMAEAFVEDLLRELDAWLAQHLD